MTYAYNRPPARTAKSADEADKADKLRKTYPRELPKKLPIWQVVSLWLALVLLLPFVIFLLGGLSSLVGIEHILPPEAFYAMAQFSLLLAMLAASVVGTGYGLIYLLTYRPEGDQFRLVLLLLAVVIVLGLVALHGIISF